MAKLNSSTILIIFSLIYAFAFSEEITEQKESSPPKESEPSIAEPVIEEPIVPVDFDSRINLDYNRGHAHAMNPYGPSDSYANYYGLQASIGNIHYPGQFHPIYSKTGSYGSGYAAPGSPYTNAYAGRRGAGGNFYGGNGMADAYSLHRQYAYPLDRWGNVLLSNLKVKNGNEKQIANENAGRSKTNDLQFPEEAKLGKVGLGKPESSDKTEEIKFTNLDKTGRKIIDKNREIDEEIPVPENKFES